MNVERKITTLVASEEQVFGPRKMMLRLNMTTDKPVELFEVEANLPPHFDPAPQISMTFEQARWLEDRLHEMHGGLAAVRDGKPTTFAKDEPPVGGQVKPVGPQPMPLREDKPAAEANKTDAKA